MSRLVFLVGTSHHVQFGLDHADEFYNFLVEACRTHVIRAVAEEANPEVLGDFHVAQTIPSRAAKSLDLRHLYCDPNTQTRAELGVVERNALLRKKFVDAPPGDKGPFLLDGRDCSELNHSDRVREGYWIDRLLELDVWPVLFVCGAHHSRSLCIALHERGIDPRIVEEDWGPCRVRPNGAA